MCSTWQYFYPVQPFQPGLLKEMSGSGLRIEGFMMNRWRAFKQSLDGTLWKFGIRNCTEFRFFFRTLEPEFDGHKCHDSWYNFTMPFKFRRPFFFGPEFREFRTLQRVYPEFFPFFFNRLELSRLKFRLLHNLVAKKKTEFSVFRIPKCHKVPSHRVGILKALCRCVFRGA